MNILITGGAGFIGKTLVNKLIFEGISVTIIDIKNDKSLTAANRTSYIQGDVCEPSIMKEIFFNQKIDGIIHLAAVSRVVDAENNPDECWRTNVGGVKTLLKAIEQSTQKPWLIFGSSREVYGEPQSLPIKESDAKKPVNIYGQSKREGERLFTDFAKNQDLNCAIVRFSNVYGNRYDIFDRVIPRFIRAIATGNMLTIEGGEQLIDFTHIDDTVNSLLKLINYINNNDVIQTEFHFCPGIGWSLYDLISFIEQAIGKTASVKVNHKRNYDVVKFVGDTTKITTELGLEQFFPLKEGIQKSVTEYLYDIELSSK